jgi:hypothetical protein
MDALMSSSMQFLSTTEAEYMQLTQAAEESYPVQRLVPESFLTSLGQSHIL